MHISFVLCIHTYKIYTFEEPCYIIYVTLRTKTATYLIAFSVNIKCTYSKLNPMIRRFNMFHFDSISVKNITFKSLRLCG